MHSEDDDMSGGSKEQLKSAQVLIVQLEIIIIIILGFITCYFSIENIAYYNHMVTNYRNIVRKHCYVLHNNDNQIFSSCTLACVDRCHHC